MFTILYCSFNCRPRLALLWPNAYKVDAVSGLPFLICSITCDNINLGTLPVYILNITSSCVEYQLGFLLPPNGENGEIYVNDVMHLLGLTVKCTR